MAVSFYLDHRTWVHRLHPVVRLLLMVALFLCAFVVERPQWLLPLATLVLGLLVWTGSMRNIYRLRVLFALIFIMTFLIWTWRYGPDGEPVWLVLGPLEISHTAPLFALGMGVKLVVFLASGILFLSTTRIEELAYAFTRIGIPYKVGFTMTLAFRLVPVFMDAALTVVQAQRCRGLDFDHGSLWQRLRRYIPIIVPVFMGGLRRADGMAMALEARGFQTAARRTMLQRFSVGVADALMVTGIVLLTGAYLYMWWHGWLAFPRRPIQ
jgi:energy-coupling factor transport system permease protein